MVQFLDGSVLDIIIYGIMPALIIALVVFYGIKKKNKESEE